MTDMKEKVKVTGVPETMIQTLYARAKETGKPDTDKAMSPFVVRHIKEKSIEGSNAKFSWGVRNGKELQRIIPSFNYQKEVSLVEGMKVLMPIYHVLGKIPAVRNISNKIIVMEK